MIKSISVENTTASCLEKWQGHNTRANDLSDELSKAHHSITLLQNKLNKKQKDIESLTLSPSNNVWTENKNNKYGRVDVT